MGRDRDDFNAAQVRVLERVAMGAPLHAVLDDVVRLIEAQADGMLCSILLADRKQRRLLHGAAPNLPPDYVCMLDGTTYGPNVGSCGAAAAREERVVVEDIATHPDWESYRAIALAHGLRACWSTPIFSPQRELLGTFAMYYREPRGPTEQDEEWVRTATHLASVAITRARTEQALREREEQLRQAQKMEAIGRLASGVAHDFNNLLSVILSYSSFLVDELDVTSPIRPDIEEILKAAERAAQLTRQLLALGRQQLLQPRLVGLDPIVTGLERTLRRVLGADVSLDLDLHGAPGQVLADPGQLEQVLMNLVVNARDAMPSGGNLTLETANLDLEDAAIADRQGVKPGRYAMLAAIDTGVGMDAATCARVFEPFFTTKEIGRGTGLGLPTVYGIVSQSGGHVTVQSALGVGTTFRIFLPLADGASAPGDEKDTQRCRSRPPPFDVEVETTGCIG